MMVHERVRGVTDRHKYQKDATFSFWCWFDTNWSAFHEDMHKKIYIFVPCDLELL